jgi:calmodulin
MSLEFEDYDEDEPEYILTDDQVADFKEAFKKFDEDDSGEISTAELGTVMRMLGHELKAYQLQDCIAIVDSDGSGSVDLDEFLELMKTKTKQAEEEAEVKEAFRILDRQNKGEINTSVIKDILLKLDEEINEEEADEMISDIDEDGSGWVDYEEFKRLMLG